MNKKNTSVLLAIISVTLLLVGSGCGKIESPASILEDVTYRQQQEGKEHGRRWKARRLAEDCNRKVAHIEQKKLRARWIAEDCRAEAARIEQKKLKARWIAEDCRSEVARKEEARRLKARWIAEDCSREVARIEQKKLKARWIAEDCRAEVVHKEEARRLNKYMLALECSSEVGCRKHKKLKARWVAEDCSWEVARKQERKEQEVVLILAKNPIQHLGLSRVDQVLRRIICSMRRRNFPIEEICDVTGYTPGQVESFYVAYQEWKEALLVAQTRQLLRQEESIKRFLSMDYPTYLLEKDRDEAHNAIMSCHTIAAIRTLGLTDPNLENPIRAQRVSELADYLMKKQRAETKKHMYKKLLSENWPINRCIDSLDPSFSSYEVKKLKKVFCNPAFPIEVADHIRIYDEDLCLPK